MGRHSADFLSAVPGEEPGRPGAVNEYETGNQPAVRSPPPPGYRRRVAVAVGVALVGVALLVIGFISLTTTEDPPTTQAQDTSAAARTTAALTTEAVTTATTSPSRPPAMTVMPVTVLNNSPDLTPGLATRVAAALEAGGWPIAEVLNYSHTQLAATTAFFTPGSADEQAAAQALVAQFPEISGGAEPRFDGLHGVGLTVATVGDWLP